MSTLSGDSLEAPLGTQHAQGTILDMSNAALELFVAKRTQLAWEISHLELALDQPNHVVWQQGKVKGLIDVGGCVLRTRNAGWLLPACTKIAKSLVLGISACCKHYKSIYIGEKLVSVRFELLKMA